MHCWCCKVELSKECACNLVASAPCLACGKCVNCCPCRDALKAKAEPPTRLKSRTPHDTGRAKRYHVHDYVRPVVCVNCGQETKNATTHVFECKPKEA